MTLGSFFQIPLCFAMPNQDDPVLKKVTHCTKVSTIILTCQTNRS